MANDKTLFGVSLGPHTPFETTIVGGSVGFAMGFVREWRRNKVGFKYEWQSFTPSTLKPRCLHVAANPKMLALTTSLRF
jgi:hypothetical protein